VPTTSTVDQPFFFPAETSEEAIARIFSLTGGQPRTRGEKRALVALRDVLGVDIDVVKTNAVLGKRLAEALEVDWVSSDYTKLNTVTLAGLNALLNGAQKAFLERSRTVVERTRPTTLTGRGWDGFKPAISKIEAVTRISLLTGAPDEWLGPGGKEHKSVLINLADRLLKNMTLDRSSKTRLASDLAHEFGTQWTDDCYSTGETISLLGLNTILAGAERRLNQLGSTAAAVLDSPEKEGTALVSALYERLRGDVWDGRASVMEMYESGERGANETEWQGWFFETRGRGILNEAFLPSPTPPRSKYGKTTFDYRLNRVWDLKAHTENKVWPLSGRVRRGRSDAILNDASATKECVSEHGLGFLVLSGSAIMDEDLSFVAWHDSFKAKQGNEPAKSNSGKRRPRKAAFHPIRVEAFWIENSDALKAAVAAGQLPIRDQGAQAPNVTGVRGAPRGQKFHMNVPKARKGLRISEREWPGPY
jgi:hypothetical protein